MWLQTIELIITSKLICNVCMYQKKTSNISMMRSNLLVFFLTLNYRYISKRIRKREWDGVWKYTCKWLKMKKKLNIEIHIWLIDSCSIICLFYHLEDLFDFPSTLNLMTVNAFTTICRIPIFCVTKKKREKKMSQERKSLKNRVYVSVNERNNSKKNERTK